MTIGHFKRFLPVQVRHSNPEKTFRLISVRPDNTEAAPEAGSANLSEAATSPGGREPQTGLERRLSGQTEDSEVRWRGILARHRDCPDLTASGCTDCQL